MSTGKDQLLGKSKAELQGVLDSVRGELTRREIKELKEGEILIKIEDFMNPIVKPFAMDIDIDIVEVPHRKADGRAIYEVFNYDTGLTCYQHAGNILHLFGKDDNEKVRFMNKLKGDNISINRHGSSYNITFLYLEYPIPKGELAQYAKKLGKKPDEIFLGTEREVRYPEFPAIDDELEEKRLILEERKLRIKEKEIELMEREAALKKDK
jgi:hypothetical protein